ncbi:5-formyltetrahydrofolate cyclo-ligase [Hyperthermus butylicus]|uniref:5-formyltetrahydrofolate cyclo-ligase n=1 Tax=Hyperthermus butylicus (strain DSM 5456 / JCM 9403 / PLM1-5) TaxID=415426 RepID=A2BIS5_HYPBU|nr:5-formyltetrahydrofolate cyclo-ligase [Hyperthermus butylicus]ABM79916.1 5-formyltetrahydrofolate cyclo-ligase [Hyperthermus butylicus DSM 5456]
MNNGHIDVKEYKKRLREHIWRLLSERGVATFPPPWGRIPNFRGAEAAAAKLFDLGEWRRARIVKANPDSPQRWVRLATLRQGKLLVMATPRLHEGFILLDPKRIPSYLYEKASTIRGAFQLGRVIGIDELRSLGGIDFIVTGSVAVDRYGHRVGKGEGYAELEYAIMRELGLVDEDTPIATTVHDLQIVDHIPREPYDLTVDFIATPTRLIRVAERGPRPPGVIWELLPCEKLKEIPILVELAKRKGVSRPCREH